MACIQLIHSVCSNSVLVRCPGVTGIPPGTQTMCNFIFWISRLKLLLFFWISRSNVLHFFVCEFEFGAVRLSLVFVLCLQCVTLCAVKYVRWRHLLLRWPITFKSNGANLTFLIMRILSVMRRSADCVSAKISDYRWVSLIALHNVLWILFPSTKLSGFLLILSGVSPQNFDFYCMYK